MVGQKKLNKLHMHKYNDKNGVIHAIVYGNSVIF